MKRTIHIIYAKSPAEIFNRQAALGSYIFSLAGLFHEHGYHVLVNGSEYESIEQSEPAGGSMRPHPLKAFVPLFLRRLLKERKLFGSYSRLGKRLSGIPADVILEFYSFGSAVGATVAAARKIPLVVVYDAPVLDEYRIFNNADPVFMKQVKENERRTMVSSAAAIVYSGAVRDYIHKNISANAQIFIHQNVDFTRFDFIPLRKPQSTVTIGFIGSFLQWHRVDRLVKAFIRLREGGLDARLLLLGTGEKYAMVKEMVSSSGMSDKIEMPGFTDGKRLLDYKSRMDIGVMPGSNWYGAPNKIFEYGAAGMAVIGPSTPTIKSLFTDGKEILMFSNDSDEDLYRKLQDLCSNAALREQLALSLSRKISENYSKNNTFDFYNGIISKHLK